MIKLHNKPKKEKDRRIPIYTVDLQKKEFGGPADLAFYDIVTDNGFYMVRYYGVCDIHTAKSFEEAKEFIWDKIKKGR